MKFGCQRASKNHWKISGFWGQNRGKSWKKCFQKRFFLACIFQSILGGFGEGFGRGLEGLGLSWDAFKSLFVRLRCQEGPRGGQEVSWARFQRVSDGFWEGFGRPKWSKYRDFGYFLDVLFETLILIEFVLIFDNFGRGDGEKHLFPHGGLLVLLEGFGSKTRCLQVAWDAWYRRR